MKTYGSWAAILAAWWLVAGCAGTRGPQTAGGGSAAVEFVNPDQFDDFRGSGDFGASERDASLADLERFVEKEASLLLPAGRHVDIRVVNLDQAGSVLPGARPVRVSRGTQSAYADLEYTLKDGDRVVTSGRETISANSQSTGLIGTEDRKMPLLEDAFRHWLKRLAKQ